MDIYEVLKTIHLSEKATLAAEKSNVYVFKVSPKANKSEIRNAIEKLLGKKVLTVNTSICAGKKRRERRADQGRTNHWKKAIVRLQSNEKLDLA